MEIKREVQAGNTVLKMTGSLSIYEVAACRDELLSFFAAGRDLAIELAGITHCDLAGVQLLYSARKTALDAGHSLEMVNPPVSVLDALRNVGLNPETVLGPPPWDRPAGG